MGDSDKKRFASLLAGCAQYYEKQLSKEVMALYWSSLNRYSYEEVADAFTRHMESPDAGQWMPKIADIKKALDGSAFGKAATAWSKVDKAIRQIGPYRSVIFDDEIIHAVISDLGGWVQLCSITDQDMKFKANEFQKRYQSYMASGIDAYPKKLTGITEATNERLGHKEYEKKDYAVIGNKEHAKLVYQGGGKKYDHQLEFIEELYALPDNSAGSAQAD